MAKEQEIIKQLLELETKDYLVVKNLLLKINNSIYNSNRVKVYSQNRESFTSYLRDQIFDRKKDPMTKKTFYYGIVMQVDMKSVPPVVYVDVPLYDFEDISHRDKLFDPKEIINLDSKAFYCLSSTTFQSAPSFGQIAIVTVDSDYIQSQDYNSINNQYIGLLSLDFRVAPMTQKVEAQETVKLNQSYAIDSITYNNIPVGAASKTVRIPLDGKNYITSVASNFRILNDRQRTHLALDLRAKIGTPLKCPVNAAKIQAFRTPSAGCGNMLKVFPKDHNYYYINLMHLSEFNESLFKGGDTVENVSEGVVIGKTGNTGATGTGSPLAEHLHMEFRSGKGLLNPLYLIKGELFVDAPNLIKLYGEKLTLPLEKASATQLKQYAESKIGPKVPLPAGLPAYVGEKQVAASMPVSRPKLKFVEFGVDFAESADEVYKMGANSISVREDIYDDLASIKDILNGYGIPFSCERIDTSLDSNRSLMSKLGLEINLNQRMTLWPGLNPNAYDFYVGPDKNRPGFCRIYGKCKRNIQLLNAKYTPQKGLTEIYNIANTYKVGPPLIEKTEALLLDVTKIFEDHGFLPVEQGINFIKFSQHDESNWYRFYKPSRLVKGSTLFEALETIYDRDNKQIWYNKNYIWDGKRFV
jgi:murein DD-endopeptidase MepM/ murein hydrolase activator NlpD